MTTLTLVDGLRKALKPYQTLIDTVDKLEALGKLEQAETELTAKVTDLRANEAALLGRLEALRAEGEQIKAEAQAGALTAKEDGLALLQDAEAKADKILLAAEEQAAGIVATAEARANTVLGEAAEYERRRDAAAAELTDIEVRLQAAREAFQRALSGA
jgi:DNA repair exonuclease SbcCD ATPase subunit